MSKATERMMQGAAVLVSVVSIWFLVTRIVLVIINGQLMNASLQRSLQACQEKVQGNSESRVPPPPR